MTLMAKDLCQEELFVVSSAKYIKLYTYASLGVQLVKCMFSPVNRMAG